MKGLQTVIIMVIILCLAAAALETDHLQCWQHHTRENVSFIFSFSLFFIQWWIKAAHFFCLFSLQDTQSASVGPARDEMCSYLFYRLICLPSAYCKWLRLGKIRQLVHIRWWNPCERRMGGQGERAVVLDRVRNDNRKKSNLSHHCKSTVTFWPRINLRGEFAVGLECVRQQPLDVRRF